MKLPTLQGRSGSALAPGLLLVVAGLAFGAVSWSSQPRLTGYPPSDPMAGRPECPEDSVAIPVKDSLGNYTGDTITTIPLAEPITDIREFHDCQKFILKDGSYGDLMAIFVAAPGNQIRISVPAVKGAVVPQGITGVLASDSVSTQFDSSHVQQTATGEIIVPTVGMPYATIYNYGEDDYSPLGIGPGFNCLYFFLDAVSGGWRAKMVKNGRKNADCTPPLQQPAEAQGKELVVHRATAPWLLGAGAYPPVARWDWDPKHLEQYISIACAQGWCEVGDTGFVSSPSYAPKLYWPPADPIPGVSVSLQERARVVRVKGWYDEQRLAVSAGTDDVQPGPVWGTIYPHPALGKLNTVAQFDRGWVHVGNAVLHGWSSTYKSKLNFANGTNRIYFCHGEWADCYRRGRPVLPVVPPAPTCAAPADRHWWARIIASDGNVAYKCVIYRQYSGVEIPGTARWRWSPTDEQTWMRCPSGCCEIK